MQQNEQRSNTGWSSTGLWIVALLIVVYLVNPNIFSSEENTPPVNAALGGVAVVRTPAAVTPVPVTPTVVQVTSSPPVNVNQVSTIVFTKNTTNSTVTDGNSFAIAEVKVYDTSNRLLTANDFSSANYSVFANARSVASFYAWNAVDGDADTYTHTGSIPGIQTMTLKLKNPTNVAHIQILNRSDGDTRLVSTKCILKNSSNAVLKTFVLDAKGVQDFVVGV